MTTYQSLNFQRCSDFGYGGCQTFKKYLKNQNGKNSIDSETHQLCTKILTQSFASFYRSFVNLPFLSLIVSMQSSSNSLCKRNGKPSNQLKLLTNLSQIAIVNIIKFEFIMVVKLTPCVQLHNSMVTVEISQLCRENSKDSCIQISLLKGFFDIM